MKKLLIFLFILSSSITFLSCDNTVGDLLEEFTRGNIICVKAGANGKQNGRGWEDAYTSLSQAIANAKDGDEIWIAGDYSGGTGNLDVYKSISIIGGFDDEQFKDERPDNSITNIDWQINIRIESGANVYLENINDTYDGINSAISMFSDAKLCLYNCKFFDVDSTSQGGAILCANENCEVNIEKCVFSNCDAGVNGGGAIFINNGKLILNDCEFINCDATDNSIGKGGAIFAQNSVVEINGCTFDGNSAKGSTNGAGGGIFSNNTKLNVNKCGFKGNSSSGTNSLYGGGAIYAENSSELNIKKCVFDANSSASQGGGIVFNDSKTSYISNCRFYDNNTINYGGGLYYSSSQKLYLINTTYFSNQTGGGGRGGAIYVGTAGGNVHMYNLIFYGNSDSTASLGDSIYYRSNVYIINSFLDVAPIGTATYYPTDVISPSSDDPFIESTDSSSPNFLRLNTNTVCYNGGYYGSIDGYTWPSTDLAGHRRVVGTIDMGCYERQ